MRKVWHEGNMQIKQIIRDDDHIKELTPGIQTEKEKRERLPVGPKELLQDEMLWYRSMHK